VFGSRRVQVVDLGSHILKSLVGTANRDGTVTIHSVRGDPVCATDLPLDEYLGQIRPILEDLRKSFFWKKDPIHIVPGDSVVRNGVHRLPGVEERNVPEILRTSRRHFIGSFSTRIPIHERSFPVYISRTEDLVHVTVVHSYCRQCDIDVIHGTFESVGLKVGAIVSPLLASVELADVLLQNTEEEVLGPQLLVEVGAAHTSLILTDGSSVVAYRKIYAGSSDWIRKVHDEFPELQPGQSLALLDGFATHGLDGLASTLEEVGLPVDHAPNIRGKIEAAWDSHLEALRQAIPSLVRNKNPDEQALLKISQGLAMPVVVFTGGGSILAGFLERAEARLGVGITVLDPATLPGCPQKEKFPLPPETFSVGIGALKLLGRSGPAGVGVAEERLVSGEPQTEERGFILQSLTYPFLFGVGLCVLMAITTVIAGFVLESGNKSIEQNIDSERAGLTAPAELQKILQSYRDLRSREVAIDARFTYIAELLRNRIDWPQFFNVLDQSLPRDLCVAKSVDVQVLWPDTGNASKNPKRKAKSIVFSVLGEAKSVASVQQFVEALKRCNFIKNPRIASSRLASGPRLTSGVSGSIHTFEVSGEIDYGYSQPK